MSVLLLSRIQFALNIGFHFFYPPISIGLGLILMIVEGLYLFTKDPKYKIMTKFWIKIFALVFAIGVATGLVQSFSFGTNWARFSRYAGDVFGSALAAEGIFAFFLEAGFLGIVLFGWDRVKDGVHYLATCCVALGAHFSAVWIIVANSWMQTPAGHKIVGEGKEAHAVITDFWAMVFNPSSMDRLIHTLLGCWLAGAFFVISVSAYYILKKRDKILAYPMLKIGLGVASVSLIAQLISGDSSARIVAKYQPEKFAALEGIYTTRPYTPISVYGWVDAKNEKVTSIKIPALLSVLAYRDPQKAVPGLDQFPKEDWPHVPLVFQAFHIMIIFWALMLIMTIFTLIFLKRKTLERKSIFLWTLVFSVLFPQIALQTGWIVAEAGRQPWVVYHLLRTADGVSTNITSNQVWSSIVLFIFMYILLFSLFLFLLNRKIKEGPEGTSEVYRDIYPKVGEKS